MGEGEQNKEKVGELNFGGNKIKKKSASNIWGGGGNKKEIVKKLIDILAKFTSIFQRGRVTIKEFI